MLLLVSRYLKIALADATVVCTMSLCGKVVEEEPPGQRL
jgi:hypothetical protein